MNRHVIERYIAETYSISGDHPFERYPDVTVYRHPYGNKWFAAIMSVSKRKLGLDSSEVIYIMNVKTSVDVIASFINEDGFFPAYHMNKSHWISITLDGSVPFDQIKWFLSVSYNLTKKKSRKNSIQ